MAGVDRPFVLMHVLTEGHLPYEPVHGCQMVYLLLFVSYMPTE